MKDKNNLKTKKTSYKNWGFTFILMFSTSKFITRGSEELRIPFSIYGLGQLTMMVKRLYNVGVDNPKKTLR